MSDFFDTSDVVWGTYLYIEYRVDDYTIGRVQEKNYVCVGDGLCQT